MVSKKFLNIINWTSVEDEQWYKSEEDPNISYKISIRDARAIIYSNLKIKVDIIYSDSDESRTLILSENLDSALYAVYLHEQQISKEGINKTIAMIKDRNSWVKTKDNQYKTSIIRDGVSYIFEFVPIGECKASEETKDALVGYLYSARVIGGKMTRKAFSRSFTFTFKDARNECADWLDGVLRGLYSCKEEDLSEHF